MKNIHSIISVFFLGLMVESSVVAMEETPKKMDKRLQMVTAPVLTTPFSGLSITDKKELVAIVMEETLADKEFIMSVAMPKINAIFKEGSYKQKSHAAQAYLRGEFPDDYKQSYKGSKPFSMVLEIIEKEALALSTHTAPRAYNLVTDLESTEDFLNTFTKQELQALLKFKNYKKKSIPMNILEETVKESHKGYILLQHEMRELKAKMEISK